ncbi:hypothetical protein TWF481_011079 [Arthrobotrys musiformis]|uniref:Uncharacterized protein n=1 Tax=Arthrobotrys musiformis TaxID=47236 RepID=A0AAV9VX86_9PEZI
MIVDASPLFTDPKLNLTHPTQLLAVLETLKRPLFILFIPSTLDSSPSDPSSNWRTTAADAYEKVCREFDKGPTPRYLAVLEVGSKEEWLSPNNIMKTRYKITTCPLLLRTQLTTLPSETGILTAHFTAFDERLPHKLRFFKKGDITHIPPPHSMYKTQIYELKDSSGEFMWTGWDYKFDMISHVHNRNAQQALAKMKIEEEENRILTQWAEGILQHQREQRQHENKRVPTGLAPSIIETEGGNYLHRVETVGSSFVGDEASVVGHVEVMESDDSEVEREARRKRKGKEREEVESVLEKGVERVDFEGRFEVLESTVDEREAREWRRRR